MIDDFMSSKITVDKNELLETVKKNRTLHETDYKEARQGFEKQFLEEAENLVARIKEGKFDKAAIPFAPPKNYLKDYDRAIRMMEMSKADEIVISEHQFSQLVLDEWEWKTDFTMNAANYKASLSR